MEKRVEEVKATSKIYCVDDLLRSGATWEVEYPAAGKPTSDNENGGPFRVRRSFSREGFGGGVSAGGGFEGETQPNQPEHWPLRTIFSSERCVTRFASHAYAAPTAASSASVVGVVAADHRPVPGFGNQHPASQPDVPMADVLGRGPALASSSSERLRVQCDESTFMPTASTSALNCSGVCP